MTARGVRVRRAWRRLPVVVMKGTLVPRAAVRQPVQKAAHTHPTLGWRAHDRECLTAAGAGPIAPVGQPTKVQRVSMAAFVHADSTPSEASSHDGGGDGSGDGSAESWLGWGSERARCESASNSIASRTSSSRGTPLLPAVPPALTDAAFDLSLAHGSTPADQTASALLLFSAFRTDPSLQSRVAASLTPSSQTGTSPPQPTGTGVVDPTAPNHPFTAAERAATASMAAQHGVCATDVTPLSDASNGAESALQSEAITPLAPSSQEGTLTQPQSAPRSVAGPSLSSGGGADATLLAPFSDGPQRPPAAQVRESTSLQMQPPKPPPYRQPPPHQQQQSPLEQMPSNHSALPMPFPSPPCSPALSDRSNATAAAPNTATATTTATATPLTSLATYAMAWSRALRPATKSPQSTGSSARDGTVPMAVGLAGGVGVDVQTGVLLLLAFMMGSSTQSHWYWTDSIEVPRGTLWALVASMLISIALLHLRGQRVFSSMFGVSLLLPWLLVPYFLLMETDAYREIRVQANQALTRAANVLMFASVGCILTSCRRSMRWKLGYGGAYVASFLAASSLLSMRHDLGFSILKYDFVHVHSPFVLGGLATQLLGNAVADVMGVALQTVDLHTAAV